MLLATALLVLSGDPYKGFHVALHPFGSESLYAFTVPILKEKGYDMTSLFYDHRQQLENWLGFATEKGEFDPNNARLYVRIGKREWFVDESGTVLCGRHAARFTGPEFQSFREMIRGWIPYMAPTFIGHGDGSLKPVDVAPSPSISSPTSSGCENRVRKSPD